MLEIGNALSKVRFRSTAVRLLSYMNDDPAVDIIPLTDDLYTRGIQLFLDRPDKEWTLTDCVSSWS